MPLTQVPLNNMVSNTLPVSNGGTGITSPGASGNVLTSDGTVWTSSTPTTVNSSQLAKAWVNFNGSTLSIRGSYNVSSVTSSGTGVFTINFTNALTDANYSAVVSASGPVNTNHCVTFLGDPGSNDASAFVSASALRISTYYLGNSAQRGNPISCCVAIFR